MRTRYFRPIFLRLTLLWALVALLSTTAFAQWKVSGVVTSADTGETLIGASVYVKETTNGTITDLDGSYELDVKDPNAILVFSYTGYITREEPVRSRQVINMALRENIAVLDEIVVIGYGTQKKSDMTGAVGTVKEKTSNASPLLPSTRLCRESCRGICNPYLRSARRRCGNPNSRNGNVQ
ncbi:MAG: carboxypeptidase-like regulatory domain-containing protein [Saprospirales bacterium]|nr:carboxypeptidase-like regulatory domain-containing protein [Saprospirales bacterium]